MARRRGRNRRRNRAARKYYDRNLERTVNDEMPYYEQKERQSAHLKQLEAAERDILSRTVFVTHVKDLRRNPGNIELLKHFFERQYGPVELCTQANFSGRRRGKKRAPPPARVRFVYASHAEKLFGGKKLLKVQLDGDKAQEIRDRTGTVGYQGFFVVRPSLSYPGIQDDTGMSLDVCLAACQLQLGHWYPESEDGYVQSGFEDIEESREQDNVFLVEATIRKTTTTLLNLLWQRPGIYLPTRKGCRNSSNSVYCRKIWILCTTSMKSGLS